MYNIILLEDDLRQNLALESRIKNLYPDSLIQLYSYIHAQDMMDQLSRFKGMNIYVLDIVLDKEASGIDDPLYSFHLCFLSKGKDGQEAMGSSF